MAIRIYPYLRASTQEQDATRAQKEINQFLDSHDVSPSGCFIENASGTKHDRPQLEQMIAILEKGDCIVIEKMDRLTRLPFATWEKLKQRIKDKGAHIVVIDQPMTHDALKPTRGAQSAIQSALTNFMLDLSAAMARDDYETRAKRQKQGIEKAKREGKYQGRPRNEKARKASRARLLAGESQYSIRKDGYSPTLVISVKKELDQ